MKKFLLCFLSVILLTGCSREYFLGKYYIAKAESAFDTAYALRVNKSAESKRMEYYQKAHEYFLKAYHMSPKVFTLTLIEQATDTCVRVDDSEGAETFRRFSEDYILKHPQEAEYGYATSPVDME